MTELFLDQICPTLRRTTPRNPSADQVRAFIRHVERQDYCAAVMQFYHEHAVSQDNQGLLRAGRNAILAHVMDILTRFGRVPARRVKNYAINGQTVFINWQFELPRRDGSFVTLDEVAMQIWDGDRIVRERFYFDPAQLPI